MSIVALIPAAGGGSRFASRLPKQYADLSGRPLLIWVIERLAEGIALDQTFVALAPDDVLYERTVGARAGVRTLYCGGASRAETVANSLAELASICNDDDWVLVHDAARPGLTPEMVRRLVGELKNDPVGGILALPVADTLKRIEAEGVAHTEGRIASTESRNGLWQAQTPQMFRLGMLRDAITRAQQDGHDLTDEASAIEWLGHAPRLIQGSLRNFKVTYPEDFALASAMLGGV